MATKKRNALPMLHRSHRNWIKYLVFTCLISLIPVLVEILFSPAPVSEAQTKPPTSPAPVSEAQTKPPTSPAPVSEAQTKSPTSPAPVPESQTKSPTTSSAFPSRYSEILLSGELALIALILAAGTLGDAIMADQSVNSNLKTFLCVTAFVIYTFCFVIYIPCRFISLRNQLTDDNLRILIFAQLVFLPVSILSGSVAQYYLIHEYQQIPQITPIPNP